MILEKYNNTVYLSSMMAEVCPVTYQGMVDVLERYDVPVILLEGTKDIWCRDFMPLQVGEDRLVRYDYDPDYLKTPRWRGAHSDNREVCKLNGIVYDDALGGVVIDGGNVVHGEHKVVMTSKVFEENPQYSVRELSTMIEEALDAELIVLPWDTNEMFGHTDGILRLVDDDTMVMTNYRQFDPAMAKRFLNCLKPHFKTIHELRYDEKRANKNNWAYINWLQTYRVVVLPSFGCKEDEQALLQISRFVPEYQGRIEMVDARDLICYKGGLNCASWTKRGGIRNLGT